MEDEIIFLEDKELDGVSGSWGYSCEPENANLSKDIEVVEPDVNFILYGAGQCVWDSEPIICSDDQIHTLYINDVKLGNSTDEFRLVRNLNDKSIYCQFETCDPDLTPRSVWTLKAMEIADCKTHEVILIVDYDGNFKSDKIYISVDSGNCKETKNTFLVGTIEQKENYKLLVIDQTLFFIATGFITFLLLLILWKKWKT